jgi:cardiolipin synthase
MALSGPVRVGTAGVRTAGGEEVAMSQQPAPVAPAVVSNRIWTIPNLISFVRLLGVPLFLYLMLGPHADVAAVIVLALGGTTDWVDGYVARRTNTVSRLGELLDPFADRLYILATLIGFTVRGVVPWWLTTALLLREAVLGVALLVLRRRGYGPPPVHYVGKTGTFVLLAAFPVILLANAVPSIQAVAGPFGWGLAWWALGLYWAAAVLYLAQTRQLLRADKAARADSARRADSATPVHAVPAGNAVSGDAAAGGNAASGNAVPAGSAVSGDAAAAGSAASGDAAAAGNAASGNAAPPGSAVSGDDVAPGGAPSGTVAG